MAEEQIDVISTKETSELSGPDSIKCLYCGCLKDGVVMFYCTQCNQWVHASCLHSGPPSSLLADNYFFFQCVNCTADKKEVFKRMKLTWVQVITLALYNLGQTSLGKQGFFKCKEDICCFLQKHWGLLYGNSKKQSSQWHCTVGCTLSMGNPHRYISGYSQFGENGWWRLVDPTKPPEYEPKAATATVPRPRNSRRSHFGPSRYTARKRQNATLLEFKAKQAFLKDSSSASSGVSTGKAVQTVDHKKENSTMTASHRDGSLDSPSSAEASSMPASPESSRSEEGKSLFGKESCVDPFLPLAALSDDEKLDSVLPNVDVKWDFDEPAKKCYKKESTRSFIKYEKADAQVNAKTNSSTIRPMSLYDEQKLLRKLLSLSSTDENLDARRLRRKLLLRQKKREMGLPVVNFDSIARQLHAKEKGLQLYSEDPLDVAVTSNRFSRTRILDRFLTHGSRLVDREGTDKTFRQKLIGRESFVQQAIVSPYTQRVLKPFIRRDLETKPAKLQLLEEIVSRHHRSDPAWKKPPTSIDYCYVKPHHIPTINALCQDFFWPGVDLSESLQYPDFSVVALYKKLVVGFGFLVPDVTFNESYISFLFVHPDWQKAGIGSFMLYHLIQTCMGKDITLHVSASNPAMILYQRYGFKPEKFEADFYDKYLPVDTHDSNHAFFMRLRR